jgi:hypothetical protein
VGTIGFFLYNSSLKTGLIEIKDFLTKGYRENLIVRKNSFAIFA